MTDAQNEELWNTLVKMLDRPPPRSRHQAEVRAIEDAVVEEALGEWLRYPEKGPEEILLEIGIEALSGARFQEPRNHEISQSAAVWAFIGDLLVQFEHPTE